MKELVLLLLFVISSSVYAQRTCGTPIKTNLLLQDSKFAAHHKDVMDYIHKTNNAQNIFKIKRTKGTVVTIPVVFHILYKNTTQNVSDAQIMSQLAVLNNDYRKLNADFSSVVPAAFQPLAADMEVVFCLATKTPTGNATTGISRKSVASSFKFDTKYYTATGDLAWDPTKYLNVWVGEFTDQSLLGWAYFPSEAGLADDGLAIEYKCFGTTGTAVSPYDHGRTSTHEIGHYFGLDHPWGQDSSLCGSTTNDDGCTDTPATNNPYYGCPTFPDNTNACTTSKNGSMYSNYMDYVDDICMAMFSLDQKTILQNTLSGPRLSLLTSNGCGSLGLSDIEAVDAITTYPNPASNYFMITSPQALIDTVEIYNSNGQFIKAQKLTQINNIIDVENLPSGTYYLRIYNENKVVKSDKFIKK